MTTTTYTSRISVPIYASWKCRKCGATNFSTGVITCERQESTNSLRQSKQWKIQESVANRLQTEWMDEAYQIITDPVHHAKDMRKGLHLENTCCSKCGKKPKWYKNMDYRTWGGLCMAPAAIAGIVLISNGPNVTCWVILAVFAALAGILYSIGPRHEHLMQTLPREYIPVMGTLNAELINYADAQGRRIPNPAECVGASESCREGFASYTDQE